MVRLRHGDFTQETRYSDDPLAVARDFADAGARWLHVVDLDGARAGEPQQAEIVDRISATLGASVAVEVAGGYRTVDAVERALAHGATRVVVGTAALQDPFFVRSLVERFGQSRIAVALDVRDGRAVGGAWLPGQPEVSADAALAALGELGARVFEVTAIDRDGTLGGPNLALLVRLVALHRGDVIASAGISSLDDLRRVRALGCRGAIVGRALYEGRLDLRATLEALEAEAVEA